MSRVVAVSLLAGCLAAAPAAAGEWRRVNGECRERWTSRDLVRGPLAIANGLVRPLNAFVGGVWFAVAECDAPRCFASGPAWVAGSTLWGLGEGVYWIATGALDTVTGGAARLSPYEASRLQPAVWVPFLESHPPSDDERCAH